MKTKGLIQYNYIRVVHLFNKQAPNGGLTVAYKPEQHDSTGYPTGKFAKVAVAVCNKKDRYSRKRGEEIAVNNLLNGHCVVLPLYKTGHPVRALKEIFVDVLKTLD